MIGYVADKISKVLVVRVSCGFTIAAIICLSYAIMTSMGAAHEYNLLIGAMCLWGVADGIMQGPLQALFADSVPQGDRSMWYGYLQLASMVPAGIGPAISMIMFLTWGDNWSFAQMRIVFMTGICMQLFAVPLVILLRDVASAGKANRSDSVDSSVVDMTTEALLDSPKQLQRPASSNLDEQHIVNTPSGAKSSFLCLKAAHIPLVLFIGDLVTALGSGCTVAFFPLFFAKDIGLAPAEVMGIYIISPILIGLLGKHLLHPNKQQ